MRVGDGTPGPGRPKGSQNKATYALREAILKAAENVGRKHLKRDEGLIAYLEFLAWEHPATFAPLLGKVLPMTIAGASDAPPVTVVKRVIIETSDTPVTIDAEPERAMIGDGRAAH